MNENSLATILSLEYVNNIPGVRMNMDASIDKDVNVILRYGTVFKLK